MKVFVGVLLAWCVLAPSAEAADVSRKKLQVFLLAGQSNMTGYCGIMPLTNLANYRELEDPVLRALDERLCKVVFPGDDAISRNNERRGEIYRLLVATQDARRLLDKAKQAKDETAVGKLESEIKAKEAMRRQLESELEVAKGKRVYIAPDGRSGPTGRNTIPSGTWSARTWPATISSAAGSSSALAMPCPRRWSG